MSRHILLIDGHPDRRNERFVHALAGAYAKGAEKAGHEVQAVRVCELAFPLLSSADDFNTGEPPPAIARCQQLLQEADHVVILYPLWLGSMPALLKGFFEQLLRPGFALGATDGKRLPRKLLRHKSARIIVTMGMPAVFYTIFYRAHSLKSFRRNVLAACGLRPVRASLVGMVEGGSPARRAGWLKKMEMLGARAR